MSCNKCGAELPPDHVGICVKCANAEHLEPAMAQTADAATGKKILRNPTVLLMIFSFLLIVVVLRFAPSTPSTGYSNTKYNSSYPSVPTAPLNQNDHQELQKSDGADNPENAEKENSSAQAVLKGFLLAKNCNDMRSVMSDKLYQFLSCEDGMFTDANQQKLKSMLDSCVIEEHFTDDHKKFNLENEPYSSVFKCQTPEQKTGYVLLQLRGTDYTVVNLADDTFQEDAKREAGAEQAEQQTSDTTLGRHEERLAVVHGTIRNPEYDPATVTVDENDEGIQWDAHQDETFQSRKDGYVEAVTDRGELIVSTVLGSGNRKILNLFHVYPFSYGASLKDCQSLQRIEYLRKNLIGRKIGVYDDKSVIKGYFCGRNPDWFYPQFLASIGTDGKDQKFILGNVSLSSNDGRYSKSLAQILAEDGYLLAPACSDRSEQIQTDIEIAKVKRLGFYGACPLDTP